MKTAVEYLVKEIIELTGVNIQMDEPIIEQAKEIEKEHIEDAVMYGIDINAKYTNNVQETAEQYYNETFKSE